MPADRRLDAPDRCYLSQPQPGWRRGSPDYAQLARVAEWAAAGRRTRESPIPAKGRRRATAPTRSSCRPPTPPFRVRRRLGRFGQDQAADRPAAAADAGWSQARTHPVPDIHQSRRRRDGGAAAAARSAAGSRSTTGAGRANCARSRVEPTEATLRDARALFAKVLDLPGGMRIGTIHAFCQSLLRRFPLEAALSPHFQLVDDRDAEDALTEARENMLAHASAPRHACRAGDAGRPGLGRPVRPACRGFAGRSAAAAARARPGRGLRTAQRRALGVDRSRRERTCIADRGELAGGARAARGRPDRAAPGREAMRRTRAAILDWLGLDAGGPRRTLAALVRASS